MLSLLLGLSAVPAPLWVTFDVANPASVGGHRILHLEDIVGPRARADVPGLPNPRAIVIASLRPGDCGAKPSPLCTKLRQLSEIPWGLVLGVILASRQDADRVRRDLEQHEYPFPLTVDTHGVVARALDLDRPGVCLVLNSTAEVARMSPPSEGSDRASVERFMALVEGSFLAALRKNEEEER